MADHRKILFHRIVFHGLILRQDLFQQFVQRRYVPLAIAQFIEATADDILGQEAKALVEGATGGNHFHFGVQYQQGLPHGIDDVVGQQPRRPCLGVRLGTGADIGEGQHHAVDDVVERAIGL